MTPSQIAVQITLYQQLHRVQQPTRTALGNKMLPSTGNGAGAIIRLSLASSLLLLCFALRAACASCVQYDAAYLTLHDATGWQLVLLKCSCRT